VRSSHGHFVKTSGLRWVCVMLLAPIPWASRVWALPFLSALAPSERYAEDPSTEWAPLTVSDWYGARERTVELVSDTAVWYHTGLPPVPLRWVLIRDPREEFEAQALLCVPTSMLSPSGSSAGS
jgi:hypothetical protein